MWGKEKRKKKKKPEPVLTVGSSWVMSNILPPRIPEGSTGAAISPEKGSVLQHPPPPKWNNQREVEGSCPKKKVKSMFL